MPGERIARGRAPGKNSHAFEAHELKSCACPVAMPQVGLEPTCVAAHDLKSCVYASSTTAALQRGEYTNKKKYYQARRLNPAQILFYRDKSQSAERGNGYHYAN